MKHTEEVLQVLWIRLYRQGNNLVIKEKIIVFLIHNCFPVGEQQQIWDAKSVIF